MRAIILAAGRGKRLEASNPDGRPKCLIEVGGKSLLHRQLDILYQKRLHQADLVVGFEADRIIEHVATLPIRPSIAFHYNPRFELGSVLSLGTASAALTSGEPVLLMDADVLFHPSILDALLNSRHGNCFLLDRNFTPGDEPVKIAVADGAMVEFRKALPRGLEYDFLGESIGFFRFDGPCAAAVSARCQEYATEKRGNAPHEEVLRDLLIAHSGRFGYEDITGLPWLEIDFPEDVLKAEHSILPAIRKELPGF